MINTIKLDSKNHKLMPEIFYQKTTLKKGLTNIADALGLKSSDVLQLYEQFICIKVRGDMTWLDGLSSMAKRRIINADYRELKPLIDDVTEEKIDLEEFDRVGHKIAQEIRRWCVSKRDLDLGVTKCGRCGGSNLFSIKDEGIKICTECTDTGGRHTVMEY